MRQRRWRSCGLPNLCHPDHPTTLPLGYPVCEFPYTYHPAPSTKTQLADREHSRLNDSLHLQLEEPLQFEAFEDDLGRKGLSADRTGLLRLSPTLPSCVTERGVPNKEHAPFNAASSPPRHPVFRGNPGGCVI